MIKEIMSKAVISLKDVKNEVNSGSYFPLGLIALMMIMDQKYSLSLSCSDNKFEVKLNPRGQSER